MILLNFCCYKTERKKENRLTCHLRSSIIILKSGFLLELSFRWCLPPICPLYQSGLLRRDRGQLSTLCGGKLLGLCPYPLLIVHPVLTVNCVSLCLCWVLNVRLIQQLLDTQQDLFDGDGRPPIFVLLQDRQTHSAWWVDIWVEYWWFKLAFGWWGRIVIFEQHSEFIESSLPQGSFLSRNGTLPVHQIHGPIRILGRHSNKTKWVVFSPGFALLGQSAESDARHCCSLTPPSNSLVKYQNYVGLRASLFASLTLTLLLLTASEKNTPFDVQKQNYWASKDVNNHTEWNFYFINIPQTLLTKYIGVIFLTIYHSCVKQCDS